MCMDYKFIEMHVWDNGDRPYNHVSCTGIEVDEFYGKLSQVRQICGRLMFTVYNRSANTVTTNCVFCCVFDSNFRRPNWITVEFVFSLDRCQGIDL